MPYKHQTESYRVIDGKRFECWGDFPEDEALTEKIKLINQGWRVRLFKMDDGMTRIFQWRATIDSCNKNGARSKGVE